MEAKLAGIAVLTWAVWCLSGVQAQVRFATIYGDDMVLQQAPAQAIVWGYAPKCDSKLSLMFDGKTMEPTCSPDQDGKFIWKAELPATMADASKTYTVSVQSDKYGQATLSNVMFGDVWICSGQSNMAFPVKNAYNSADEIADSAKYPLIHLFTASRNFSDTPLDELIGIDQIWASAGPSNVGVFSAACWFFAKNIYKTLKYPIGLVHSSWGGTGIEAWSSPDSLQHCESELKATETKHQQATINQNTPSVLYNAMIRPFVNMTMKGALWYQGEHNANSAKPQSYICTFPAMIDDWRVKWYNGTSNQTTPFYFGFAQLAPVGTTNDTVGGFPVIRWAQTAGYGYVPNPRMKDVFMAVTIDLGDPTSPFGNIHPRDKEDVGLRLAIGARSVIFNDSKVYYLGMLPQKAQLSNGGSTNVTAIAIAYGPPDSRGKLQLKYPYGFEIGCGDPSGKANTTWLEGVAKSVTDAAVNVEFPLCTNGLKPMSVRYCWRADPCTFNKCPIYSSTTNTSPPFIMNLE